MKKKNSILISVLVIFLILLIFIQFKENRETGFVIRVIDGDTFVLDNGKKVRLLCINTPEKDEEGYKEAKDFLEELVYNKSIELEKDISERDKFGRLLRYVYVNETFVNKELYQRGHAKLFRYLPDISKCDEIYRP